MKRNFYFKERKYSSIDFAIIFRRNILMISKYEKIAIKKVKKVKI